MPASSSDNIGEWPRCPRTAEYFNALFRAFAAHNPLVAAMADRFRAEAGVDMQTLIDHWHAPDTLSVREELTEIGMVEDRTDSGAPFWKHPNGRFPRVRIDPAAERVGLALAVEDITNFADSNDLPHHGRHGDPDSGYEEIQYNLENGILSIVVRQGYAGFEPGRLTASESRILARTRAALRERPRDGDAATVIRSAASLLRRLTEEVHRDRLVDEFYAAERDYYLSRNAAARTQYERQQKIGIGWANHDHHTYRCSREGFRELLELWIELGFEPREQFYAGVEAGWGAQVLEHPVSRVVLFCDVDMAPEELGADHTAAILPPLDRVGTIGLWCALHGDSIAQAGLHHLEAEFDFAAARDQLIKEGFDVMAPFTDLPMLKQAFTVAEVWPVTAERAGRLLADGLITVDQHDRFVQHGAPGSHLEILQRWEGYKGFNKTGINAIIRQTDARNAAGRNHSPH